MGYAIRPTIDGEGPNDIKTYVVRTDANGDTLWTRTLNDMRNWGRWSVFKTTDEGLVIAALDPQDRPNYPYGGGPKRAGPDSVSIKVITIDANGNVSRPK